jgi:hypothetical protein
MSIAADIVRLWRYARPNQIPTATRTRKTRMTGREGNGVFDGLPAAGAAVAFGC